MESISYRYQKASNIEQILTYPDFMYSYDMLLTVNSFAQANDIWNRIRSGLQGRVLESFADFNHTILHSIEDHKMNWTPYQQQLPLLLDAPQTNKREREDNTVIAPQAKRRRVDILHQMRRLTVEDHSHAKRVRLSK
jgi:hypothetical protein